MISLRPALLTADGPATRPRDTAPRHGFTALGPLWVWPRTSARTRCLRRLCGSVVQGQTGDVVALDAEDLYVQ